MNRRDRTQHHVALMLLACAFAFVYLLVRQFQGADIVNRRHKINQSSTQPTAIDSSSDIDPGLQSTGLQQTGSQSTTGADELPTTGQDQQPTMPTPNQVGFSPLNALPQSFIRLGLKSTQGVIIDDQRVIVTTNTNDIAWQNDRKTLTKEDIAKVGLSVDSLTFYNDPSWAGVLVVMEVVRNNQTLLIQAPYLAYRDRKDHLNAIITQLTQKR